MERIDRGLSCVRETCSRNALYKRLTGGDATTALAKRLYLQCSGHADGAGAVSDPKNLKKVWWPRRHLVPGATTEDLADLRAPTVFDLRAESECNITC